MNLRIRSLMFSPLLTALLGLSAAFLNGQTAPVAAAARADSGSGPSLVLMSLCAHPDDEDGGTLAYHTRLRGIKSYGIFFTRGEGGQNEIGSELYQDLGAIRTNETIDAAKLLGSHVYFLGFPDFGFSKTAQETFAKWGGEDSVVARLVYYIRALKPDIIVTNHDTVTTRPNRQHGNHQAVGIASFEAFTRAADPNYHPEQLSGGVTPWQVKKLYWRRRGQDTLAPEKSKEVELDISARDSTGQSIADIALSALQQHRSQGFDKLTRASVPDFLKWRRYVLVRSDREYPYAPHDLFSGIQPSPRITPALPSPEIRLAPFAIRVSPEAVPRKSGATIVVRLVDREASGFTSCEVRVTSGGRALFRKTYAPGTRMDTVRLRFDLRKNDTSSTLLFTAVARSSTDSVVSTAVVRRIDLPMKFSPGILVGLVKTYDDTHEETLRSFGIPYRLIDSTELAGGPLDRYSTILLDLRTYEYRPDAVSHNDRLLEYVKRGGNIVCCYHKSGDWNGRNFPPLPIRLTSERVTQEDAPVTVLLPRHRFLTNPNVLNRGDWDGWVQERSIYLPSADTLQTSARYDRILSMSDEGEEQPPTSLLSARWGQGSYTYVSLVLYRQLRILHRGAVKLFLNLVSQRRG